MTGIWFDTCLRINNTLAVMQEVFGNRKISIARELTKTYEEIITSDLNNIIKIVDERKKNNNPLKGEVILIVDGYVKKKFNIETLNVIIKNKLEKLSLRDTVNEIITETKLPRRVIYNEAIKIRNDLYKKINDDNFFFNLLFFIKKGLSMRNLLFISIITFFLQSCAPIVGTVGMVSLGAASKEKGLGTSINDNLIKTKISNLIYKYNKDLIADTKVFVNNGSVLFTGKLNNPNDKIEFTKLAWNIRGVKEVNNEIQVTDMIFYKKYCKRYSFIR